MPYTPPFLPEDRAADQSLAARIARARKLREEAAERIKQRYADVKQREGEWRTGDRHDFEIERPRIL